MALTNIYTSFLSQQLITHVYISEKTWNEMEAETTAKISISS